MNLDIINQIIQNEFESGRNNLVSVGYGFKVKNGERTGELSFIYRFKEKKPLSQLDTNQIIPKTISLSGETYTTDVIEGVISPIAYEFCPSSTYWWQQWPPPVPNRNFTRPLKGGLSISNFSKMANSTGTLGFIAVDNDTNSLVGVTNNHVIVLDSWYASLRPPQNGKTNAYLDKVIQPNEPTIYGFQYEIGYVKKYVPITGLTTPVTYNKADAALCTLNQSDIDPLTSFQIVGMTGWTQPMEFATTSEIDNLLISNPYLFSAGRTSGAKGEGIGKLLISSLNTTSSLEYYKQGVKIPAYFSRCIEFIMSSSTTTQGNYCYDPIYAGDSGSALCAEINGVRKIIGVVFAAGYIPSPAPPGTNGPYADRYLTGVANRIDDVASLLNISAWTGQTVNYTNLNTTESVCLSTNASDKFVVLSGKTFWQLGLC